MERFNYHTSHFHHRHTTSYFEHKKAFIRSVFNTIGVSVTLLIINNSINPHNHWSRLPILIMVAILFLKGFKLVGHKVSEKIHQKYNYNRQEDVLNLEEFQHMENRKTILVDQKPWKDSDLVKSGL